jgi:membrane protease YdiL (CAAX protease family)
MASWQRELSCRSRAGERRTRMSAVRRHPLVVFFVLAYALSWWPWILYAFDLSPLPIVGFGPFLAAIVVLAVSRGKAGVMALLRRMVRWRVSPVWYAVALLLPIAITVAATVLNVLFGAQAPSSAELSGWTGLVPGFFVLLLVPGFGGAWEEPGWRGYALPRLQVGRSALLASLILGLLWAFWHLPLMVVGEVNWSDIVLVIAASVVFAWVFNSASGSVLIAMVMHAMNNTISGSFFGPMFSGADSVRESWLLAALWVAVAIVVVVATGPEHLSRKHSKQEPAQYEIATPPTPRVA